MLSNFLLVLATLCTQPSRMRLNGQEVLQCQQYYAKCMRSAMKSRGPLTEFHLADELLKCVENKKNLGGSQ